METFLEFLSGFTRKRHEMTDDEIALLLKARSRIVDSDLKKGIVDKTGSLEDPYFWIGIHENDGGGGVRVYVIFGDLAIRLQRSPGTFPHGPATKVTALKGDEEEERKPGEEMTKVDTTGVSRLYGEIKNLIRKTKKTMDKRKIRLHFQNDPAQFQSFWSNSSNKTK